MTYVFGYFRRFYKKLIVHSLPNTFRQISKLSSSPEAWDEITLGFHWDVVRKMFTRRPNKLLDLPEFGPIEIDDYGKFLERSKEVFKQRWDSRVAHRSGEPQNDLKDFQKLKMIGAGSFGKVYLVQNTVDDRYYAMKAIAKQTILKFKQLEHTKTEKQVLRCNNCPFAIRTDIFFKDTTFVYFVVPFMQGGELYRHLRQVERFEEPVAAFFVGQVMLALQYLHHMDILYRDLKPENILMDHLGYLKLADFGFSKLVPDGGRTYTLCGTPEYLAPEVILNKGYGTAVDWWGVGVLAYELVAGYTPFREKKTIKVYEKIVTGTYKVPRHFSEQLRDLVRNILQSNISKRFGCLKGGVQDLKGHAWFQALDWQELACRRVKAPYVPNLSAPDDVRYFRHLSYESLQIEPTDALAEHFHDF